MGRYVTNTTWLPSTETAQRIILGLDTSDLNTATIDLFITRREGMIDSYIGKRWAPTYYATSPSVIMMVQDMVNYDIYDTLFNADGGVQKKSNIRERYEISLAILKDLTDGTAELYDSSGTRIEERDIARRYWVSTKGYVQTFDEGKVLDWRVSPSKLDDLYDDKESDNG